MPGFRRRRLLAAVTVVVVGAAVVLFMPRGGQTPPTPAGTTSPTTIATQPHTETTDRSVVELFATSCAACHGEGGKGDGPNAQLLDPRPRDFTTQSLRFAATGGTREQILAAVQRTISRGLPHSGMPGFQAVMSPTEIASLADLVLARGGDNNKVTPAGSELAIPRPPEFTPGLIERGREVYLANICASCHGAKGQADGAGAPGLTDMDGNPIRPADLSSPFHKSGATPEDIYRTILMGVPGTPMAAYKPLVAKSRESGPPDDRDAWALVALIDSFSPPAPPLPEPAVRPVEVEAGVLSDPDAAAWFDIRPVRVILHQAKYTPGGPTMIEIRAARRGAEVALRFSGDRIRLGRVLVVMAPRERAGAPLIAMPPELPDGYREYPKHVSASSSVIVREKVEHDAVFQVMVAPSMDIEELFTGWVRLDVP